MISSLDYARNALLNGNKPKAKSILVDIVMREPQNADAWLLLAETLDDPVQISYCRQRAQSLVSLPPLQPAETQPPVSIPIQSPRLKKCPYCAEEIQFDAIVCRYCGRDLVTKPIPVYPATPADSVEIKKSKKKTSAGKIIIFFVLLIVGACVVLVVIGNALNKTTTSGLIATPTPAVLIPANYGTIASGELQAYADQHKGEKVKVALDIVAFTPGGNNQELQGFISGTSTEIIIELVNPASGIYVNDTVTIYGTINGNHSYTSVAGWKMTQPQLINAFYTNP